MVNHSIEHHLCYFKFCSRVGSDILDFSLNWLVYKEIDQSLLSSLVSFLVWKNYFDFYAIICITDFVTGDLFR